MLCFMRAFEVHVLDTPSDIDLAIKAGVLEPHRLDYSSCSECEESIGHITLQETFEPFCVVIDADDNDWVVCVDCASPIVDGLFRATSDGSTSLELLLSEQKRTHLLIDDEEFDTF